MTKRAFEAIREGLEDTLAIVRGEAEPARVHIPPSIDVKAIRRPLKMSQQEFADRFGFTAAAVRDWEQKRRTPEGAARAYLLVIQRDPDAVIRALTA